MRTVKNWAVVRDWPAGFYNPRPCIMVRSRRGTHVLATGQGTGDDVEVFQDGDSYYVLCVRRSFPYVGLARFTEPPKHKRPTDADRDPQAMSCYKLTPTEPDNDVFAQGGEQVADCLGDDRALDRLTMMTIAKRLREYVD